MENSIEEDIINAQHFIDSIKTDKEYKEENGWHGYYNKEIVELARMLEHILSEYKRVLKENEIYKKNSEIMSKENLSTAEQLKVEIKENFRLKNQLENNRKEYQETYKDVREELRELKKENEELKQDRNTNYQMIALAQNEMLGYIQGYEDGKKLKRSAVACAVENQQYYIIKKEIEHYKEYIEKLQKENEKLKNKLLDTLEGQKVIKKETPQYIKENYIPVQKVKDKIKEEIKYHEKNILDIENTTMLKGKTTKEEAEIEFNKYAIVVLKKMLQELLEKNKIK